VPHALVAQRLQRSCMHAFVLRLNLWEWAYRAGCAA